MMNQASWTILPGSAIGPITIGAFMDDLPEEVRIAMKPTESTVVYRYKDYLLPTDPKGKEVNCIYRGDDYESMIPGIASPFDKIRSVRWRAGKALQGPFVIPWKFRMDGICAYTGLNNRISDIYITSSCKALTSGGTGIGSTLGAVKREFGSLSEDDESGLLVPDMMKGIGFETCNYARDALAKISEIWVWKE